MKILVGTALISALILAGCTKTETPMPPDIPKAPLSAHREMNNDGKLMIAYIAAKRPSTIPYAELAQKISPEYAQEQNEFKKRDLLEGLQPEINHQISLATSSPFYYLILSTPIGPYDFSAHTFPIRITGNDLSGAFFFDFVGGHRLVLTNSSNFNSIEVLNEQEARSIADQRSTLKLKIYFTATNSNTKQNHLNAHIYGVQLINEHGSVLAEQFSK